MLETFQGSDLRRVMDDARQALGDNAVILRSHIERRGRRTSVEVLAAAEPDVGRLTSRLAMRAAWQPRPGGPRDRGPFIVALTGPAGAGKTTTVAKLALNARVFGEARIGLATLDTFRVAGVEQLRQYADIAGLPLEVVYDDSDVRGALKRLHDCDVILIDTPGRSVQAADENLLWQSMLRAFVPDETHLVLPATLRADAVADTVRQFEGVSPTHLLVSRTDDVGGEPGLVDVVARTDLPLRWITLGQRVPDDIRPARGRVLSALGMSAIAGPTALALS